MLKFPKIIIIIKSKEFLVHSQTVLDSTLIFPADFPKVYLNKNAENKGSYFIGINQSASDYLTIITEQGIPQYYNRTSARLYDFKIQESGMLTYYDSDKGIFYGMDSLYQIVDSFYCKNGYSTNFHELQVLPNGHAFLLSFDPQAVNMDTVKKGGDTAAVVFGCVIQEINEDKVVVWQWRSWDHYKITDADSSFVDFFQHTVEYCHINSIDVIDENKIIFSAKNLNEITEVNRNTGNIIWRLGGYNDEFSIIGSNSEFKQQHDARLVDDNKLSVFDNRKFDTNQNTRALIFNLNEENKSINLIKSISHSPEVRSKNMGNIQTSSSGNYIIGWGNTGRKSFYMSEVDNDGNTINNDSLISSSFIYSYRAFKFPWKTKIITANKDSLLFTNSSVASVLADSISIKNNSSTSLQIGGIFYKSKNFKVIDDFPIDILPGKEIYLHFNFQKLDEFEVRDTAYIVAFKSNEMASLPIILVGNSTTNVHEENSTNPHNYKLFQNFPNPFNPTTNIYYSLPSESKVRIVVYDILGKEITTLIDRVQNAGIHSTNWNAVEFSSGVYYYKIIAEGLNDDNNFSDTKKMVLIK